MRIGDWENRCIENTSLIINKQSFAAGLISTNKKRKRMGLPSEISFKKRNQRRRGKQKLRKKGK